MTSRRTYAAARHEVQSNERELIFVLSAGSVDLRPVLAIWGRPRMRILVEVSTESEWVAQHPEHAAHEVVVANPNYAPKYGYRWRRPMRCSQLARAITRAAGLRIRSGRPETFLTRLAAVAVSVPPKSP